MAEANRGALPRPSAQPEVRDKMQNANATGVGICVLTVIVSSDSTYVVALTAADLKTLVAERHIDEAGIGVETVLTENLLDAGCSLGIFSHHVEVTTSTGSGQLVTEAEVIDERGEACHLGWVGTAVEQLVLLPGLADQPAHLVEVFALDGFKHIDGMLLHLAEQRQFVVLIEEHAAHNLCQYLLGGAGNARIVEQMTRAVLGLGVER